jgi:hypothetical protein
MFFKADIIRSYKGQRATYLEGFNFFTYSSGSFNALLRTAWFLNDLRNFHTYPSGIIEFFRKSNVLLAGFEILAFSSYMKTDIKGACSPY